MKNKFLALIIGVGVEDDHPLQYLLQVEQILVVRLIVTKLKHVVHRCTMLSTKISLL